MLTRLRIQNFKAWKDTGDIRLAPLTILFGTNSSGKTSLLQFLLMLKQTVQSTDRRRVLHFGDRHSLVDLGTYPEMVFNQDPTADFRFEVEWRSAFPLDDSSEPSDPTSRVAFEGIVGRENTQKASVVVKQFAYRWGTADRATRLRMQRDGEDGRYMLFRDAIWPHGGATWRSDEPLRAPIHFHRVSEPALLPAVGIYSDDPAYEFEDRLNRLQHLGPLRDPPERTYSWSGEAPEHVGLEGELTLAALLAAQDRTISVGTGTERSEWRFMALIAEWLLKMGLLESFEVRPIAPQRRDYEVWVKPPASPRSVNLADVGFGISQALPVLVQCFYAEPDTTSLFEQPELHLHPRAQTALADLFIDAVNSEEEGKHRGSQFLVESHSEHFLRRLQRRIAEGKLHPEQTALYFCQPGFDGATIEELKIDEYGRIANWPSNFFGDAIGETEGQMEAMLRRMEQEEQNGSE